MTPTPWKEKDPGKKVRKSEANQVQAGEYVGVVMADPPLVDVPDDRCWLCGGRTEGKGQPVKKAIKPTFTDRDKARGARSQSVCAGCAFCLSHLSLRNYSIFYLIKGTCGFTSWFACSFLILFELKKKFSFLYDVDNISRMVYDKVNKIK